MRRALKGIGGTIMAIAIVFAMLPVQASASCTGPYESGASRRTACATPICYDNSSLSMKVTTGYYMICSDGYKYFTETTTECCR